MGAVTRRSPGFIPRDGMARRHRPDYILIILSTILLAIGVVIVYAISPALAVQKHTSSNFFVTRQLVAIGLGVVVFTIAARIPLQHWRSLIKPLLVVAGLATLMALALPTNPDYPAHRWIRLGDLSFQSVELLKFALLIGFATFLAERVRSGEVTDSKRTLQPLLIVLVVIGVVVAGIQSDLGSMGVIVAMMGLMAFIAGLPMRRLLLIGGVIAIGLILAIAATPYRRDRLLTFLHPESNCLTTGYQACQALISVGSGGLIGLGLGKSVQAYGYLPEAENDSIFAIYSEKFGFVGAAVLLALFMALFARLKNIIERAPDTFSRLVVTGVLAWFSTQAIINIGAMIGLLPLKGITLPFISYGGSSVLLVMAALGVVFQVSRYTSHTVTAEGEVFNGEKYENSRDRRRLRGAYHPDLSSRS